MPTKYANTDWTKGNAELAIEFGVAPKAVSTARNRRPDAPPPAFRATLSRIARSVRHRRGIGLRLLSDASAVRLAALWLHTRLTMGELAGWVGVSPAALWVAVSLWTTAGERNAARSKKSAAAAKADPRRIENLNAGHIDWSGVDFRLPLSVVARKVGCSAEAVAKARDRLGKAPCAHPRCSEATARALGLSPTERKRREAEIVRRLTTTDATVYTLAEEFRCRPGAVYGVYRRHTTPELRHQLRTAKSSATMRRACPPVLERAAAKVREESLAAKRGDARPAEAPLRLAKAAGTHQEASVAPARLTAAEKAKNSLQAFLKELESEAA